MKKSVRRQSRIPGLSRIPQSAAHLPEIAAEIDYLSRRHNCSKSFVVSVALQEFFGFEVEDDYRLKKPKTTPEILVPANPKAWQQAKKSKKAA